jgi:hypothetical protein
LALDAIAKGITQLKRTRIKGPRTIRNANGTAAGREIPSALTELADVLEVGQPLRPRFIVRTVIWPRNQFAID